MDGRVRLRQWLEGRLNTGYIQGLIWIDKPKGIFKIPWKHHSKHTWQEDDAAIFKDWAVVTGRYHEGFDSPDWPMWKTRLRCALNKAPDIQEVRQHHNLHCDDPFKVYRFISKTESIWRANASRHASLIFDGIGSATRTHSTIANNPSQLLSVNNTEVVRRSQSTATTTCANQNHMKIPLSKPITLIQKTDQGHIKLKYISIPVRFTNTSLSHFTKSDKLSTSLHSRRPSSISFPTTSINSPIKSASCHSSTSIIDDKSLSYAESGIDLPSFKLSDVMEPEVHQVCLRIQHLEHRVSDMIVNNPNGCCIYFGRFDENLTSAGPEPIEPQIYQYVSESNKYCVDMLLDNMQRGVVLSILDGSIYAEKLCKCATFVYRPGNNGEFYFVDKLNRRDKMMIFDYRRFLEELHYFQRGFGEKPHVELILAFGQQIKDNSSPDSLYVWCRLASCKAWFLLQRAMLNGCKSSVLAASTATTNNTNTTVITTHNNNHHHIGNEHKSNSTILMEQDMIDFSYTMDSLNEIPNMDFNIKQEIEDSDQGAVVVAEELIEEENVVDNLVYGENCLSDELGIGVGQEIAIGLGNESSGEEYTNTYSNTSVNYGTATTTSSIGRSQFEVSDLNYQFETTINYEYK